MVIHSLPEPTLGQMKLVLTRSENIKTFPNISCHLELEVERMGAHQTPSLLLNLGSERHLGLNAKDKGGMPKELVTLGLKKAR